MSVTITTGEPKAALDRPLASALWRGTRGKCPHCGKGRLFRAYLKVVDECDSCGTELHHQRADDVPAYLTIVVVGHILIGLMLHLEMAWHVDPKMYLYTLLPLAVVLPLLMLPWVKGAAVGLQWALGMHGFGAEVDPETGI